MFSISTSELFTYFFYYFKPLSLETFPFVTSGKPLFSSSSAFFFKSYNIFSCISFMPLPDPSFHSNLLRKIARHPIAIEIRSLLQHLVFDEFPDELLVFARPAMPFDGTFNGVLWLANFWLMAEMREMRREANSRRSRVFRTRFGAICFRVITADNGCCVRARCQLAAPILERLFALPSSLFTYLLIGRRPTQRSYSALADIGTVGIMRELLVISLP